MFAIVYSHFKYFEKYYYDNYKRHILEYIPDLELKPSITSNEILVEELRKYCENNKNKRFVISLSGGVDSMVIATIIKYLGYEVIAGHINYNNRQETYLEEKFIKEWCADMNIKLYIKNIKNYKRNNCKRKYYETIIREYRFDFYKHILKQENMNSIILAHHKDDVVENIFANISRGRNILNLKVMENISLIDNVIIERPLINYYKNDIYDFAHRYQIPYFKDTTPKWSVRGKYRNEILPKIEETFGNNFKNNLFDIAEQADDWSKLIYANILIPFFHNVSYNDNYFCFKINDYINYPIAFWRVALMNLFHKYGYNCLTKKAIIILKNAIDEYKLNNIALSNKFTAKIKLNENNEYILYIYLHDIKPSKEKTPKKLIPKIDTKN